MSNKKNSRSNNKSGKNNSNKKKTDKKRPGNNMPTPKGVSEKPISKENLHKQGGKKDAKRLEKFKEHCSKIICKGEPTKTDNGKLKVSDPEPNLNVTPRSPLPKKRYTCVVCGTEHTDKELSGHLTERPHQQRIAFLQDFKDAIPDGKEKPDRKYTKLTGEVLRSSGNNGWYCNACNGQVPPIEKPQDHLVLPKHETAVQALWEGLKGRRAMVSGLRKKQVPQDVEHTFYEGKGHDEEEG